MSAKSEKGIVKVAQSAIVQYGTFDLGDMEEAEKLLPVGGGSFFKPKEGKNVIRFLPPLPGKPPVKLWYKHFFQAGGERKHIVCTKYQLNQPCPVCDQGARMRASSNRLDVKRARAFQPTCHVYANIVDMANPEKGVQLWAIPQGLFKKIRRAIDDADVGKIFADPKSGFNIIVRREGSGPDDTEYFASVQRESTPLPDAAELIGNQVDLENAEQIPGDEDQDAALDGEYDRSSSRTGGNDREQKRGSRVASPDRVYTRDSRDQRRARMLDPTEEDAEVDALNDPDVPY